VLRAAETWSVAKKKSFVASERNERSGTPSVGSAELNVGDFVFVTKWALTLTWHGGMVGLLRGSVWWIPKPSTGAKICRSSGSGCDARRAAMSVPGAVMATLSGLHQASAGSVLAPRQYRVMDNVPTHKMPTIAEAIAAVGARVHSCPLFARLRRSRIAVEGQDLFAEHRGGGTQTPWTPALSNALATITRADIKGWFAHGGYVDALN